MSFGTQLGCSYPAKQSPLSASTQLVLPSGSLHTLGSTCCENGRPLITDPLTGQSLCACQVTPGGPSYVRLPGLPDGMYGSPGGPHLGPEPSAFYSPLNAGINFDQDRSPEAWKGLIPVGLCPQYDTALAGHPYANFYSGLDLNNAARRKNATRETTSALKAWLYEHRKNPYPTKGEKIMLAIITKMTLTQVSTWFANARRRLKKESKINWTSKDNDDDCGPDNSESDKSLSETDTSSKDILGKSFDDSDDEEIDPVCDDLSDISAAEDEVSPRMQHVDSPSFQARTESTNTNTCSSQAPINNSNTVKPKIWSISNIIEDNTPTKRDNTSSNLKLSRPSILHYDSALHKDGTIIVSSNNHIPCAPSTVSNPVIDSQLSVPNHTLETPPHTPPEGASTSQHVHPSKAFNLSLSSRIQERFTNTNGANRLVLGTEDV